MGRKTEDQRLSLSPSDRQVLRELSVELDLSINKTVAVALRDLAEEVGVEVPLSFDEVDQARIRRGYVQATRREQAA